MHVRRLHKQAIKDRGWTDRMIARILGGPDIKVKNPYGPHLICLYNIGRVESAERSDEFREMKSVSDRRRKASLKAVTTKRQKLELEIANIRLNIPVMERKELIQVACENYNSWNNSDNMAGPFSAPAFLERICVNELRHSSEYDECLDDIYGRVGKQDAYISLKEKVLELIADLYPWLADEADRQLKILDAQY